MKNRKGYLKGGLGALLAALCCVIVLLIIMIVFINVANGRCECDCDDDGEGEYKAVVEDDVEEGGISVGDYITEVDEAISRAESNEEKAELYLARAIKLWYIAPSADNNQMEKIIDDLKRAEALSPSMESAWWLYYVEDACGDQELAQQYLSLAEERGFNPENGAG